MKKSFRENGFLVLIASLLLTSVITISSAVFPGLVSPLTNLIGSAGKPVQVGASAFTGLVERYYDYVYRYDSLKFELETVKGELSDAREQLREARDALEENESLRNLLNLQKEQPNLKTTDVRITSRSTNSYESTMTLSRGSKDGIAVGNCVITGTGYLIGVVQQVGLNWSRMITILDPNIRVSATVYRTDTKAMLQSDLNTMLDKRAKLDYITDEQVKLIPGDEVLTSGANGTYPAGYVIGYVDSYQDTISGMGKYALIDPAVDFSDDADFGLIYVVTEFDAIPSAPTAEEIAAAEAQARQN